MKDLGRPTDGGVSEVARREMLMVVRAAARPFACWVCLATVAGCLMLLAGCSDPPFDPRHLDPWFAAVGGSSANDVYAVGSSTIWHYNGRRWVAEDEFSAFMHGVWAPASNDAYIAWGSPDGGLTGKVYHFDGRAWSVVASAPAALESAWGTSGRDVYAVGREGWILHYDGNAWSAFNTGRNEWLQGVWGSSPQDVFVSGLQDSILHYDGARWTRQYTGAPSSAVWGSSSHDVFTVGGPYITHYDGVSWSPQSSGTTNNLFGIWGSAPNDVFAVGTNGTILHYDGSGWSTQASGTTGHLYGVWGSSKYNVFAVGQGAILRYDGTRWSPPISVPPPPLAPSRAGPARRLTAP